MVETSAPIEVTTRYATTVDDLGAAWAFVMDRLDRVGPDPSVSIRPIRIIGVHEMEAADDRDWQRQFEVVVEGMVSTSGPDGEAGR